MDFEYPPAAVKSRDRAGHGVSGWRASKDNGPSPGPTVASFAAVNAILTDECVACHSDTNHPPHFIGHEDALKANASAIYTVLTTIDQTKSMPPPRKIAALLTGQQKAAIIAYPKRPDDSFGTASEPIPPAPAGARRLISPP